jgi:hypothetical protein
MIFDLPLMLMIVVFLALGIFSQWLANKIKWPSIVVMAIVKNTTIINIKGKSNIITTPSSIITLTSLKKFNIGHRLL